MHLVDLTHLIEPAMPVYPGTAAPVLSPANTIEEHGFRETILTMTSHTGTHMDAPAHLFPEGATLDARSAEQLGGSAYVLDCTSFGEGETIPLSHLLAHEADLRGAEFLLLATGWDKFWHEERYFGAYPALSEEAAAFAATLSLKGIGMDTISVDPMNAPSLPNHRLLLKEGTVIIENLKGLVPLAGQHITFYPLPLNYANADGAPIRAIAVL